VKFNLKWTAGLIKSSMELGRILAPRGQISNCRQREISKTILEIIGLKKVEVAAGCARVPARLGAVSSGVTEGGKC